MDYILDTHVLLWSMFESAKLSQSAQAIMEDWQSARFAEDIHYALTITIGLAYCRHGMI